MRMTVSLCVILLELTNNLSLLPLIMLVLLVSKAVADLTGILPIYDLHIHIKKIPLLEASAEKYFRHLTASDVKSAKNVSFSRVEKVGFVLDALKSCEHNGFPVVDLQVTNANGLQEPSFLGVVLRSHLLVVLKRKLSFVSAPGQGVPPLVAFQYDITDFTKPISSKGMRLQDIELTDEELNMYEDHVRTFTAISTRYPNLESPRDSTRDSKDGGRYNLVRRVKNVWRRNRRADTFSFPLAFLCVCVLFE